jgi:biopolymer transport protein ExbD
MQRSALSVSDDAELDLNPLIDVITILIIFFIVGGSMSDSQRELGAEINEILHLR